MDVLKAFRYSFQEGPFSTKQELVSVWDTGNCRRAVQWFFYAQYGLFLTPDQVLLPQALHETGAFIQHPGEEPAPDLWTPGDLIYADKLTHKDPFNPSDPEHLIRLHTAIHLGNHTIWHATSIEGKSCTWAMETFFEYYRPIAVKRLLDLNPTP